MNRSLLGWIAAVSLVGMLSLAGLAPAAQDDASKAEAGKSEAAKSEAAKSEAAKPESEPAAEKPAEEKPAAEKASEEKPADEKPAAEKPADEKPADEKPADEKPADEKPAAGKEPAKEVAHGDATHGDAAHGEAAHGDGHGHHDPTDLSHANDGPGHTNVAPRALTGIQELKADLAIYTFIVFLLLAAVLMKFGWKPIMSGLDKREQSIRDLIAQTERNAAAAEAALKQHEAKLAAAADEVRELQAKARRDAEKMGDEIVAKARAEAQRDRERALADIEAAKNVALREIAQKSVNTAVGLAGRILQREVSAADHAQLISDALEKFPSRN